VLFGGSSFEFSPVYRVPVSPAESVRIRGKAGLPVSNLVGEANGALIRSKSMASRMA